MSAAQAKNLGLKPARQPRQAVPLRGDRVDYLELTLPWPPSLNSYYRIYRGRMVVSREGKAYRETVGKACLQRGHLEGRLYFGMETFQPDQREHDLDNLLKCLWDSLQACGTFQRDSQIDVLRIERKAVRVPAVVTVCLWELAEEET